MNRGELKDSVIYCGGYPEVQLTLYLATHMSKDSSLTVIIPSTHPDLLRFFQVINEKLFRGKIKLVCHDRYPAKRANVKELKKLLYLIPDIVGERQYLKRFFHRYFAGLEGAEVYFTGRSWAEDRYYLVKKLSRKNRLVYAAAPNETYEIDDSIPTNIVDLVNLIILKLIYGRDIALGRIPFTKFAVVPDSFIKKEVDRFISLEERERMLKSLDLSRFKEVFHSGKYSIIYFHDDLHQEGYISDGDTFRKELAEIFNVVAKYFPEDQVARKYHPDYPGDKTMVAYGKALEDFIPGEFLYSDSVKIYLSLFSCALANVEKGLAVSIAELITFRDDKTRSQMKEMLIGMSRSPILFPKSLDEFEAIIARCAQSADKSHVDQKQVPPAGQRSKK